MAEASERIKTASGSAHSVATFSTPNWLKIVRRIPHAVRLISLPAVAISAFAIVPIMAIVMWSFCTWDPLTYWIKPEFSMAGYLAILEAGRWSVIVSSLVKAAVTALICLAIGFPTAYVIHFIAGPRLRLVLQALITLPFLTSYLIRGFSWRLVLGREGLINNSLIQLGLIDEPLDWLLFSDFAVVIGLIASYLPFATFPLLLAMRRVEPSYLAAAQDLGASFTIIVRTILLPLTKSGLLAGFLFVLIMVLGASSEVQMLGGAGASIVSIMISDVMRVANFPLAFAVSTVVMLLIFLSLLVISRYVGLSKLFEDSTR